MCEMLSLHILMHWVGGLAGHQSTSLNTAPLVWLRKLICTAVNVKSMHFEKWALLNESPSMQTMSTAAMTCSTFFFVFFWTVACKTIHCVSSMFRISSKQNGGVIQIKSTSKNSLILFCCLVCCLLLGSCFYYLYALTGHSIRYTYSTTC